MCIRDRSKAESVQELTAKMVPVCEGTQVDLDGESVPEIETALEMVLEAEQTEPVGELVIEDDVVSSCVMTEIILSRAVSFFFMYQRHF